ncbi:TatD family hydrolase [Escherichia coli]|uniref:TatD family hydrolase n=1 Tax=Escherichia coli TaxID=562 RepID=UPI000A648A65
MQALAENYQPLYAALGLHPGMLEKHSDVSLDQLQQALERRPAKVVAVGESGLDLFATIRNLRGSSGFSTNN